MNKNTLLTLGALAVVAYFVFRKKKPSAKEVGQSPDSKRTGKSQYQIEGIDKGTVAETTATLKANGVRVPKRKLIKIEDIKVGVKEPVIIAPANVIPNVYDRTVGEPIFFSANGQDTQSYYNMSGYCSENTQKACKCAVESTGAYKLEIPTLP